MSIPIIHQDEHLLVVNKPSGLLSVPGRGPDKQDCLINRVLEKHPNARTVHRLDQPTSGLVIIALNYEGQRAMGKLFEQRQISKCYIAIVGGEVAEEQGEIDLPLICDWPNRPRQMVDHKNGKSAQTRYRVLQRDRKSGTTRVELTPITGRSHQLRVHMRELGHPILGDSLYAPETLQSRASRLLLHARTLRFKHPLSDETLTLTCEPDF